MKVGEIGNNSSRGISIWQEEKIKENIEIQRGKNDTSISKFIKKTIKKEKLHRNSVLFVKELNHQISNYYFSNKKIGKVSKTCLTIDKTFLILGFNNGDIELCDLESKNVIEYPKYSPSKVKKN